MKYLLFIILKKKKKLISLWIFLERTKQTRPREHMFPSRCIGSGKNKNKRRRIRRGSRSRRRRRRRSSLVASARSGGLEFAGCIVVPHGQLRLPRAQPPRVYTPLFRSDSLTPLNLSERRLGRSCFFLRDRNARPARGVGGEAGEENEARTRTALSVYEWYYVIRTKERERESNTI